MAGAIAKISKEMAAIDKYNATKNSFAASRQNFIQAQQAVQAAARAMREGSGDAKKLEQDYKRAVNAVTAASRAFNAQKNAAMSAKRGLDDAGISAGRIVAEQRRIAAAVDKATASLQRQDRVARHQPSHGGVRQFAGQAAATYVSAHGVAHFIKQGITAGAHLQHERVGLANAGRTPAEMLEIERASNETTKLVPTSTFTENLKVIGETTGAFGDLHHAIENLPFMMKSASVLHAAAGDKIKESPGEMGNKMARFFEMRGTAIDSPVFRQEAEQMIRAMAFTRGTFNPSEMLLFGQQATPGTLANYNERFLSKIAPSLVTEFGGDRAGTAANAFRNTIMGKARDQKQADEWLNLGLLDPKLAMMKAGHATSWRAGAVKGTDLALQDPLQWAETILLPALQKKGVDIDNPLALTKSLGTMFRNSMANRMAEALTQKRSRLRLHKDEHNINQAGALDEIYQRNLANDPTVAITGLAAALDNLASAASSPGMKTAAEFFTWTTGWLQSAALLAKEHPTAALTTGAGVAGLGLAGTGLLALQMYSGFGLAGSAVALDGSAAALSSAAVALGGKGVISAAAPAATAAATWAARAVPFIGYGATAASVAYGLYGMYETTRPFEGLTSGERMKNWRGGSMGDVYTKAFNEDRERLGIPALGAGTGGAPVKAELTGIAKVTGEAKITIEIPGMPNRTVNVPLNGTVNANGPGSVGTSSPDAFAHPPGP